MNKKLENAIYFDWLWSDTFQKEAKEQLKKLSIDYVKQNFVNKKMEFGTAGIRAKMGPGTLRMNSITYQQMAEGYAKFILEKHGESSSVVIGHDNRMNADNYAIICANVLTSFGIKVFLFPNNELMATPIISYMIIKLNLQGGIIITASHNPKDYLGFKTYNETGGQTNLNEEKIIYKFMPESKFILQNTYKKNDSLINYIDDKYIKEYFIDAQTCLIETNLLEKKFFNFTFTAHHGTASYRMVNFLKDLNYVNVIPVKEQCIPDPLFSNSPISNPEDPESFKLSLAYAKKYNAKLMLAVDPDADRLAVAVFHNDKWRYLTGNEMGILFVYYLLSNKDFGKKPFVVSTFVSTYLIDKICKHFDAKVYRTPTGFKWLGEKITEKINHKENFVVAFEEAIGSLNSTINRDKDSFQSAALILEIYDKCYKSNMTLIDMLEKEIFDVFGYWAGDTVSYLISGENWKEEISIRFEKLKKLKVKNIVDLKIKDINWNKMGNILEWNLEDNNWVKFRMSGTEPKFKIYYNIFGENKITAEEIFSEVKKEVDKILKNL